METSIAEALVERVRERLGATSGWEAVDGGEMSQAFTFDHRGRGLVARMGPRREGFDKDAWAARRVNGPSSPVPDVIEVGAIEGGYYCVSERSGGERFDRLDERARRRAAPAVHEAIEAIAAVDLSGTHGYGSFDPDTGHGPHPTWAAHLRSLLPAEWDALDDPADIALAEELTAVTLGTAQAQPPARALVHGDLNPGNFNVDGTGVSGIFDWEAAVIGDPLWEVARHLLWAPFMPAARDLAEFELEQLTAEPDAPERLRYLVIANGLWAIGFYLTAGRGPETELVLRRLHRFRDPARPIGTDYWTTVPPAQRP